MKLSNRVLSVLLLVVFVLTSTVLTPAFAAGFSDVAETDKYSKAVTTLNTLGIINGYEDGTFKPENNVTRAVLCPYPHFLQMKQALVDFRRKALPLPQVMPCAPHRKNFHQRFFAQRLRIFHKFCCISRKFGISYEIISLFKIAAVQLSHRFPAVVLK